MKTLASILGLFFAGPLAASAFTLNSTGNPNLKGWDGEVKIYVNTANCPASVDVIGLVSDAVSIWNNVPLSSVKVSYGGTTTSTGTMTNPPTVYCETNYGSIPGNPSPDYVPGAASVSAPNGQIVAGRIFLNATSGNANVANFSKDVNTITMAHEIGHLLGLGHSHSTASLMYYDGTYRTKLTLSQDDMDGMSYLYPSDELAGDKIAGCGLVRSLPPGGGPFGGLMIALLFLPIAVFLGLRARTLRPRWT